MDSELYPKIYAALNSIPKGAVTSYGAIAKIVGCGPRQVGYALRGLPKDTKLPWYRVVNSSGRISLPKGQGYEVQHKLLCDEGIDFNLRGRIDMRRFAWHG